MATKPKYTPQICKLFQSSTRLKEQVAGRLVHYWKEDLKGGKSKTCAVFLDGQTFQNVLTAEAWSDADQAHAEQHLKPLLGQVVALENGKITSKGKTTVFHGKQIKLSYDKSTVVKKLNNDEKVRQSAATFDTRRMLQATLSVCHFLSGLHPRGFWTAQSCD